MEFIKSSGKDGKNPSPEVIEQRIAELERENAAIKQEAAATLSQLEAANSRLEMELAGGMLAAEAMRRGEQNFRLLSEAIPQLVWIAEPDGTNEYFNQRWADYTYNDLNQPPERDWGLPVHPADRERSKNLWTHSLQTGEPFEVEYRFKNVYTGEYRWFLGRALPIRDEQGRILKWFGTCTDIHEQKMAEERSRLLAGASPILAASLDFQENVPKLAQQIASMFSDYCLISLLDEKTGQYERIAVAHENPEMLNKALELDRLYPRAPNAAHLQAIFQNNLDHALLVPEMSDAYLARAARNEEHLAGLKEFGLKSVIIAPLVVRGRLIGDLTLITTADSGRIFNQADRELAEELSRRIAVAIDNARLYHEAQAALETQRELDYLKDLFLSVASHELRSPLTSIKGYTQFIQRNLLALVRTDGTLSTRLERLIKPVENMLTQSNRMNDLINQLMDFSRIQNHKLELQYTRGTNLVELVERVVEQHRLSKPDRPLVLLVKDHMLPATYDEARLEQVLDNLINNALKYSSPQSTITVGLEENDNDGRAEAVIWVKDEGIGISADDQQHIFDRFYRVRSETTATVTGLGLGLYVSYEIVALHGGRMWLESELGKGSTFYFAVPLEPAAFKK